MMRASFATILVVLALAAPAHADELGAPGDVVLSCPIGGSICLWHQSSDGGESYTFATVAADVMVGRGLTVGVVPIFRRESYQGSSDLDTYGATLRVGYFRSLGAGRALWPRIGVSERLSEYHDFASGTAVMRENEYRGVTADIGLLFEVAPHLAIELAPRLDVITEQASSFSWTTFDVRASLSGWF